MAEQQQVAVSNIRVKHIADFICFKIERNKIVLKKNELRIIH